MAKLFEGRKLIIDLFAENGATGRAVEDEAKEIVEAAHQEVIRIFGYRLNSDDLEDLLDSINYTINKGPDGPYAIIGIRDRGEIENYLAAKEQKEQWFSKIIQEVRG